MKRFFTCLIVLFCTYSFNVSLVNAQNAPFIITIKTDNPGRSDSTSFIIPTNSAYTYNYEVDWNNDGEYDESGITGNVTHDFGSPGTFTVRIRGNFPAIYSPAGDPLKILSVNQWGDIEWRSFKDAFFKAENLTIPSKDVPDLSRVTDMSGMFVGALTFNEVIGSWDVSHVTDMSRMFSNASSFNQDIGNWDVNNVINMASMFNGATSFNQDIGNWEVSNVTDMQSMFVNANAFDHDLGNWDVSNVADMSSMFSNASSFNQDISDWDVSNVTDMSGMFIRTSFNQDIGKWDVSNVTDMGSMFSRAFSFNQDIANWNIRNVADMKHMLDYSGISIENYDNTLIGWITNGYTPTNIYLTAIDLEYCMGKAARNNLIENYHWTIFGDSYVNSCLDQSSFIITIKTDNPGSSDSMSFEIPTNDNFTYDYEVDWNNDGIFESADITTDFQIGFPESGTYTFRIRGDFPSIYFNNEGDRLKILSVDQWGDIQWESLDHAFAGAENIEVLAADTPDLATCENLSYMFQGATSLNQNIGGWDISQVTNMTGMLDGSGLSIDNYDNTLIGWSTGGDAPPNINFGTSGLQYCRGKEAREDLISRLNWTVTGDSFSDNCMNQSPFVITVKTNNPDTSDSTSFTIPVNYAYSYNYEVDWNNDGVYDESGITGNVTHDFGAPGIYTIRIKGDFPSIYFNYNFPDRLKILSVDQWGDIAWESFNNAFAGAENLTIFATDHPDLSQVTDLSGMFAAASSFNTDIGDWNVSKVIDMHSMFIEAVSFNQDIGNWDVGTVVDMRSMFDGATSFNQDIGDWDVSNVVDMQWMFDGATYFNQDISNWNVSKVTNMLGMFSSASAFNQDIGNWDVSNVTDMSFMFDGASTFNQDIGGWEVGKVTKMIWMFRNAEIFNQDIGGWDVSNVTELYGMFAEASTFNQDISDWKVNNITNMYSMFAGASSFNGDLGKWDVSNVTNMFAVFSSADSFNQDISDWNVSNVTDMLSMFSGATSFNHDIGEWDISNVMDMRSMLDGSGLSISNYDKTLIGWASMENPPSGLVLDAGGLQYCNGEEAREMLINDYGWTIQGDQYTDCDSNFLDEAFVITIKTDNPGSSDSTSFTIPTNEDFNYNYEVDWNNDGLFDTSGVVGDITHLYDTTGIHTIRIKGDFPAIYFKNEGDKEKIISVDQWGDIEWKSFSQAFYGAVNLTSDATDAPNLSEVNFLNGMFQNAESFNGDISNWDVSNIKSMAWMFSGAKAFNQDIGTWDVSQVTNMAHMFQLCSSFNHDIGGWDVSNVTSMNRMFDRTHSFNQDIGNWDVSKVTDMTLLFQNNLDFNQDIGDWDVSSVRNMRGMFNVAFSFNQDISDWDVSKVENMGIMFRGADSFNQNIGKWDVSNVKDMHEMFSGAESFDKNLGSWKLNSIHDVQINDSTTVSGLYGMLDNTGLSISHYDSTLIGWAMQDTIPSNITLGAAGLQYCNGKEARQSLINDYGWTIIGDQLNAKCDSVTGEILISVLVEPIEGGLASGAGTYNLGDTIFVKAVANPGYIFTNWTENDTIVSLDADYYFNATEDRELIAHFIPTKDGDQFEVTTVIVPQRAGQTTGDGFYDPGETATLTAIPNEGYSFDYWTYEGRIISTDSVFQITIGGNWTFVAHFEPKEYQITANANPEEGGMVFGAGSYFYGDTIVLIAEAVPGYSFVNWTEGGVEVSTRPVFYFVVTADRNLVANFRISSQELVTITTTSDPIEGGQTTGTGIYPLGDLVTVTASANEGYKFDYWSVNDSVYTTQRNFTFTVLRELTLVAHFSPILDGDKYQVITLVEPKNGGLATGSGLYDPGETATLTAITNHGYVFEYWTYEGRVISTDSVFQIRVSGHWAFKAHFKPAEYQVSASAKPEEGGMVFGSGSYFYGDSVILIAELHPGYKFVNWTEDGIEVSRDSIFRFVVTGDRDLTAHFSPMNDGDQFQITTIVEPEKGGQARGGGFYESGEIANLVAIANEGFVFEYWTYEGQVISTDSVFQIMVGGHWTFIAHFVPVEYEITASTNPEEAGMVFGAGSYFYGDTVTFIVESNPGFRFVSWTEDGLDVSKDSIYSFVITGDRNLVAHFASSAIEVYTVSTSSVPEEGGITIGSGIYNIGDTVEVFAFANDGYEFVHWTENDTVVSTSFEYSFYATSDRNLIAHFLPTVDTFRVTTSAEPEAGGQTSGSGTYYSGDLVIVAATPNEDYVFLNWTENGSIVSTNANYFFTLTGNRDLVAHFKLKEGETYSVIASSDPVEGGVTTGSGVYEIGDTVTVSAATNEGYQFVNWTENDTVVSLDSSYLFIVTGDRNLVAHFIRTDGKAITITTSTDPEEGGTTTGAGIYSIGATVIVSAVANDGYRFVNWTANDTIVSTTTNYFFTASWDRNLVAHFTLTSGESYNVITSSDPIDGGVTTGSGIYDFGDTLSVIATANDGYVFANWTENDTVVSTESNYFITVNGDRNLVAHFTLADAGSYIVTTIADPEEGGTATGSGMYDYRDTVTVGATENEGYTFMSWTENGIIVAFDSDYPFVITQSRTLTANFFTNYFRISVSTNTVRGGLAKGGGKFDQGDTVSLTARAHIGYRFINWTEGGMEVSRDLVYNFPATADRKLQANFELTTYQLNITSDPENGGSTSGSGYYDYGEYVTVSAEPVDGFVFVNWTEDGKELSKQSKYSFIVTRDRNIVAHFEEGEITAAWDEYWILSVYPNPVRRSLMIKSEQHILNKVELIDMLGRVAISETIENGSKEIILDVRSLWAGMYILKLKSGDDYHTMKVLKLD